MQPKLLMFQQFHVPPISACCIEPTGIRVPTARRVRAEPRQPVFTINPERHFISHNSSRLAVSRAVRVFREKPSEKFSRAVPKFALVSVTSITPRLSPSPSFLVRIVRTDLRSAPREPSTEEKPLIPPIPPPLLALIPSIARHVTPPNNPVLRQYRGFLQHLPLPPSRFRPPPPPRSHSRFFAPVVVWPPRPSRRRVLARRPARHSVAKSARAFPPWFPETLCAIATLRNRPTRLRSCAGRGDPLRYSIQESDSRTCFCGGFSSRKFY